MTRITFFRSSVLKKLFAIHRTPPKSSSKKEQRSFDDGNNFSDQTDMTKWNKFDYRDIYMTNTFHRIFSFFKFRKNVLLPYSKQRVPGVPVKIKIKSCFNQLRLL